jgi:hypothetical protein
MSTDPRRASGRRQDDRPRPEDSRRARARRRRGRAFALSFAVVVGVLVLIAGVGAVVTVAQGPRVTDVSVDPDAAVAASGARMILTTTQALREVSADQVEVEPSTPFTVDTSGRNVGVRFGLPLADDTEYTVRIRDVRGLGEGPAATVEQTFRTPTLGVFLLQRGTAGGDVIFRGGLGDEPLDPVFAHAHIEDFRATAAHLVVSIRTEDDRAALVVTKLDGSDPRELPIPGNGFVSNLQSADRGERIGYTFSDASLGADGGRESVLYTASLAEGAANDEPTEVAIAGDETRVTDWRFVPDTDSILVLTFDSRLLLAAAAGAAAAPLGSALGIDGIARGSSLAIVERFEGRVVIDLTDGSEEPLVEPVGDLGVPGDVTPIPGADAGTIRAYAQIGVDSTLLSTDLVRVAADGVVTQLAEIDPADGVLQTCVSPSGRYVAVLVSPDSVNNPYDQYLLPLPELVQTRVLEVATGDEVTSLPGFDISWCQAPPL